MMVRKRKEARKHGQKSNEIGVFFTQKSEEKVKFQTEHIVDVCDWSLDDFVDFIQTKASQEIDCCIFSLKDERNYKAIQRLNTEAALRGIHLPIPVKIQRC
ncbi:MAG: hypothetical protein QNJ46_21670 [Leptolyngbyaceae cyanobacterium MO_188.B28]|nr:hypothetical protein [Leptolyngbyaceae cyanobacterium MO_188.B28]